MRRTVIVFAKPPRMGLSKTRLAAGLGAAQAARISRFLLARTMRECEDPRWQLELRVAPDMAVHDTLGALWPPRIARRKQGKGDLGARLARALDQAPRGQVLFVGTDAPDISRHLIWQAFAALQAKDAVFGPADDGGFWLFGLNKRARTSSPFFPVRWSGPHAMEDVRANLDPGARVTLIEQLADIDTAQEWANWCAKNRTG